MTRPRKPKLKAEAPPVIQTAPSPLPAPTTEAGITLAARIETKRAALANAQEEVAKGQNYVEQWARVGIAVTGQITMLEEMLREAEAPPAPINRAERRRRNAPKKAS